MRVLGALTALCCILSVALWALRPALPDDPPIALESYDEIETIAIFGTSLSHPARYTWPDDLARALSTCLPQTPDVIHVTRAGGGSDWALQNVENVSRAKPDLILLEFAINDSDLLDGLAPERSRKNHAALLDILQARLPEAQIVMMTMNPVSGLNWLKRYRLGTFYRLYSSLVRDYGAGLIHMHPHWDGYVIPDGVHPQNEDASAVMVPQLLTTITGGRCPLPG